MKPNFALELSLDGIRLHHLAAEGAPFLGEARLDDPEFEARVDLLRRNAEALSDGPLRTELVIPNSEILYCTLPVPGGDDTARRQAVRAGLEGRTPYTLDELVFDWCADKDAAQVAAVARQTLDEAQAFAAQNGFNPVRFTARPEAGAFPGQPDFGPVGGLGDAVEATAAGAERGQAVEPPEAEDRGEEFAQAVPEKPVEAGATVAAHEPGQADSEAARTSAATAVFGPPIEAAADAEPGQPGSKDIGASPAPTVSAPPAEAGATASTGAYAETARAGEPNGTQESVEDDAPAEEPADRVQTEGATASEGADAARSDSRGPGHDDRTVPDERKQETRALEEGDAKGAPTLAGSEPSPGLAALAPDVSGRKPLRGDMGVTDDTDAAHAPQDRSAKPTGDRHTSRADKAPRPSALDDGAAVAAGDEESSRGAGEASGPSSRTLGPKLGAPGLIGPRFPVAEDTAKAKEHARPKLGPSLRPANMEPVLPPTGPAAASLAPARGADGEALAPEARDRLTARMAAGHTLDEEEALTVFGARSRPERRGGRRIVLAAGLAAVVAAGAAYGAWNVLGGSPAGEMVALDSSALAPEDRAVVLMEEAAQPDLPDARAARDVASAPEPTPAGIGPTAPVDTTSAAPEEQAVESAARGQADGADVPERDAAPTEAATDSTSTASATPVETASANAGTGASVDMASSDAQPDIALANAAPGPLTPQQAVTRYAATGIWQLSPEEPAAPPGGAPNDVYLASVDPEVELSDLTPLSAPPAEAAASLEAPLPPAPAGTTFEMGEDGRVVATPDGALSPAGVLVTAGAPPITPPQTPERPAVVAGIPEELQPTTGTPAIRPRPRPATAEDTASQADDLPEVAEAVSGVVEDVARDDAVARAVEAARASSAASLFARTDEEAVEGAEAEEESAEASPYAVARSLRPASRPEDLEERVAPVQVAAASSVVTPSRPTAPEVARRATLSDELNLRRLNLVGVYGSDADRRALVRLPSGRFVKVKVGDSVDGGRIAAIGESEIRYIKNGRDVTLSMPQG